MTRPKLREDQKSKTVSIKDTLENKELFQEACGRYGMGKVLRKYLDVLFKENGIE